MSSREPKAPPIATLLQDRFDFVEFLGKGGFASVYKVRRISLARTEALKVLVGKHSEDVEFGRRFQQEARVAASLEHPNIVHIYDFGDAQGTYWYSMQFVDGPTVTSEMKAKGPLSEEAAARLAVSLLDALDYSHGRGVVHRDIKPDNLILDRRGHPYLMDFGIAKSVDSMVETQSGFVLGSPAYLSPEQLRGETLDGRTDVYSFGITLYEMLSGGRPFDATDRTELMIQRLKQDPIPIVNWRPGISEEMAAIVMKALARERGQRYGSAAEMRDELSALLADRTSPASSSSSTSNRRPQAESSGSHPAPSGEPAATQPTALLPTPTSATVRRTANTAETIAGTSTANRPPPLHPPPLHAPEIRSEPIPKAGVPGTTPRSRPRWAPALLVVLLFGGAIGVLLSMKRERPGLDRPRVEPTGTRPSFAPAPATSATSSTAATTNSQEPPKPALVPTIVPEAATTPSAATATTASSVATAPTVPIAERTRPSVERTAEKRTVALPERTKVARAPPLEPIRARREVKTPPVEEHAEPVKLSPELAQEYAGKSVFITFTVTAEGSVRDARLLEKASPRCDECDRAALEAIKRYRFRPALDAEGLAVENKGVAVVIRF